MINTDQLVSDLRICLGHLSFTELDDNAALLYLNRSYWAIQNTFPFREKETTATFLTEPGIRNYVGPIPFEAIRAISIMDFDVPNRYTPLDRQTVDIHETDRTDNEDYRGKPQFYLREGSKIRLRPIPDNIYTISVKYLTTLDDLARGDSNTNLSIPTNWHEIVLYGGAWRAYADLLRDFTASANYKGMQESLIRTAIPTESKEEEDSHRAGVEVLGRDYP